MPDKYAPQGDEMDDSYGAGEPLVKAPSETAPAPEEGEASVDEQNAATNTGLVANKILNPAGKVTEGDEFTIRITAVHGDQSEFECVSGEEETAPGNEDAEIAALDEKG